jgi:diadenylate cyclase
MGELLGLDGWRGIATMVVEVVVFATAIYAVMCFLTETRGMSVVRGLVLIIASGVLVFVAVIKTFKLVRLERALETLAGTAVIGLIVVFHPEIRRAISRFGESRLFGRLWKRDQSRIVQRLLRTVARMQKERIGALIAIEREASLETLAETGARIDAELNSLLLESIFYRGTVLHDGAVIVRGDRVVAAAVLLPLSQRKDLDPRLGTRHRAALGLAEETDALAIVVSEETGKLSVAVGGELLHDLTLEGLENVLEQRLGGVSGRAA